MFQRWTNLVFLHWALPAALVRPLVPSSLELDLFDGSAWVGVAPFTVTGMRPAFLPALPGVSSGYEINVRTYVYRDDDMPAVWFFSMDASNALAVWGARLAFHLPYFRARMHVETTGENVRFRSRRTHPDAPVAELDATWHAGEALPEAQPGTLDFFLLERYCLYASDGKRMMRGRIHHRRWPVRRARLMGATSTMLEANGIPSPSGDPLVHAQGTPMQVAVWRPRAVRGHAAGPGDG